MLEQLLKILEQLLKMLEQLLKESKLSRGWMLVMTLIITNVCVSDLRSC